MSLHVNVCFHFSWEIPRNGMAGSYSKYRFNFIFHFICFTFLLGVTFESLRAKLFCKIAVSFPFPTLVIFYKNTLMGVWVFWAAALTPQCWEFQFSLIHWRLSGFKLPQTLFLLHGWGEAERILGLLLKNPVTVYLSDHLHPCTFPDCLR